MLHFHALHARIQKWLERRLGTVASPGNRDGPVSRGHALCGERLLRFGKADSDRAAKRMAIGADLDIAYRMPVKMYDLVVSRSP